MLHNIRASFAGVPGVGLDAMLVMILLAELPPVAGLIALHWYAQPPDWGGELAVTFGDWDDIAR